MPAPVSTSRARPTRTRSGQLDPKLVLHPVHLRIIAAVQRRPLTTAQIAEELPRVPQATLYRYIARLVAGGALIVSGERWVHGARERTYTVHPRGAYISRAKLQRLPKREIIGYFNQFLSLLSEGFSGHVETNGQSGIEGEQVRFYLENLLLTDAERRTLHHEIRALVERAARFPASPERHRQTIAHISFPSLS